MVVDDEPAIREILEDLLSLHGFTTVPAGSAEEAEEILSQAIPHLILLDIMLPKVDGFTFLKTLKANPAYREIPVICVSVLNRKEDFEKGKNLGAADYVIKPFDPDDLVARMKKILNIET
jgi:two-component system phosphate regulon response regulator PhoB